MQQCRLRLCVIGKLSYIVVFPWLHRWLWHLWLMQMLISLIPYEKYIRHCEHCSPHCQIVHANFNSPVSAYNCRQLYLIIFYNKVYVIDRVKNCPQNNIKQHTASDWNVTINIHDWGMLVVTNVPDNWQQPVMEYTYYCCIACHMQHNISCNDKNSAQGKFNQKCLVLMDV